MLFGFDTRNEYHAAGAQLIYAVYRSRVPGRGPSGLDMWGQIERFARASAKRAANIGDFLASFKRRMGCETINPRWMDTGAVAETLVRSPDGELIVLGNEGRRNFMLEIVEGDEAAQRTVVDAIYERTQNIILLVRDRLEREKPLNMKEA